MRVTLLVVVLVAIASACQKTAPSVPDPPGAEHWGETTNVALDACRVGISNIWSRDAAGPSAQLSILEADGGERSELVHQGSTMTICGHAIHVVRVDVHGPGGAEEPGAVWISR